MRSQGRLSPGVTTRLPVLPRKYLPRRLLWDSLEAATEAAVTMLVAPVGAGKTLGVVGWLRSGTQRSAVWVAASPDLSVDDFNRLSTQTGTDGEPQLLVIDDAHTLSGAVVADVERRLNDEPRSMHLLLISRWDLPLARLAPELRGDLAVLRGDLLRLSDDEAATLVAEHARTDSAEVCAAISTRAHGWCAAVVLAARAVAGARDPVADAQRLMSGSAVLDTIASDVFAALTARQRHLLLCLAGEEVASPALARHLSHDDDAGRLLEELESTGLLVTRYVDARQSLGDLDTGDGRSDETVTFRLHPLLVEVARRRLVAGGVDVERARATVRRAVAVDVELGESSGALRRLVAIGALDAATRLLVDHGVALALAGEADALTPLVRHHPAAVESSPICSLTVALHRWLRGDFRTARHWLHRMELATPGWSPDEECSAVGQLALAAARLLRARLGDGALEDVVPDVEESVRRFGTGTISHDPVVALVKLHLGSALIHLGRLADADLHLTQAIHVGRSSGLPALAAEAASALAMSQYLQGREHICLELAAEAARGDVAREYAATTLRGVLLARRLAVLQSVVHDQHDAPGVSSTAEAHDLAQEGAHDVAEEGDVLPGALTRLLISRSLLLRGLIADAERALDSPTIRFGVPCVLRVPVLLEQALQATLACDNEYLARLERELTALEAVGEAALVAALRAEGLGEPRVALDLFESAARCSTCVQPPVAAIALIGRAQLLFDDHRVAEAMTDLRAALATTELRRNALPFLGWSRHGAPVVALLRAGCEATRSAWCRELLETMQARPGITSVAGALTATPRERAQVTDGVVRPALSSRERDVLRELARGATYADIAASLYVSENTVKTHVSSLYAKLAVRRRSEALAVARTLALL